MCGIAGFLDHRIDRIARESLMSNMLSSIKHRGPDASNSFHHETVSLGHNRLSIIDLSSSSDQPMMKDNLVIVFNGEIYNYKEIRKELVKEGVVFVTNGDTEVLLEGYRLWGEKILDKLLGMFAFVIYNQQTESIFGARDRFGIKPFYFIHKDASFYFASEVKALRTLPVFNSSINQNQAKIFLNLGWYYNEDQTLFDEVKSLCAGQKFTYANKKLEISTYYSLERMPSELSDDDTIEQFEAIFLDSLRIHLRTDVQLGALLSGGIDSSAIVSYILEHKLVDKLKTFSIYYDQDNFDERPFINEVISKYPNKIESHFLSPNEDNIVSELERINHIQDFPIIGSSAISQYFIMEAVSKQDVKVVLSGQGADDFLAGYMHSYYRFYAGLLRHLKLIKFYKEFRYQKKYQGLTSKQVLAVVSKSMLSTFFSETSLYQLELKKYHPRLIDGSYNGLFEMNDSKDFGKLNGFLHALMTKANLPNLLHLEDRNSMAFSIESRVPFLDHRLVECGINSRPELKIKDGLTKFILREACKNSLPEKIYHRKDKKGFVTPGEITWLRGNLRFLMDDMKNYPFEISDTKMRNVIDEFKAGNNSHATQIWRLCMLNYWQKRL